MNLHTFQHVIMDATNCDADEARKVIKYYENEKVCTFNVHDGYRVKHGAFLDADVLVRALDAIHA